MKYCMQALLCLLLQAVPAKSQTAIAPLTINNRLAPVKVTTTTGAAITIAGGKPVILDFFSIYCKGCLQALPHLKALQQQFKECLHILLFTSEDAATVNSFIKRGKYAEYLKLPVIAADTAITPHFPYTVIPHEVWIDGEGNIKAITTTSEVTPANVQAFINGRLPQLPLKKDMLAFNRASPLLAQADVVPFVRWSSTLSANITGVGSIMARYATDSAIRFCQINYSLLQLYATALNTYIGNMRLPQPSLPFLDSAYTYELVVPAGTTQDAIQQKMRADLDCFFNGSGAFTDTLVNCLMLTKIYYKKAKQQQPAQSDDAITITDWLADYNTLPAANTIIVADSLLPTNAQLPAALNGLTNVDEIEQQLQLYGFTLVPAKRRLNVFVFTPKQHSYETSARQ